MDRLWSPWRLEYVTGAKPSSGCVFCLAQRSARIGDAEAADSLVVFRGRACYVILNLYPYNNGHVMVVPYRHIGSLTSLTSDELQEMALLTQRSETALIEAYNPQGINVGMNLGKSAGAGVLDHVHMHLVPRWSGDTNFMTVVGEARVLPEDLASGASRLRVIYKKLDA